jgi:hypothetical protein
MIRMISTLIRLIYTLIRHLDSRDLLVDHDLHDFHDELDLDFA